MNIADAARFITEGVTMTVELSDNVDKKIDAIREEVKEMVNNSMDKIDRRWYITQVLLGIGLVGNAIAMML
tara:strand:- start:273 stop:485 length:213 start_codon:yes stop_codon:yes gene_type:complete